jgi:putative DNA primase/helicase
MQEVTLNRQELTDVLLEFAGYTFANEDCTRAKALMLLGEGQNGKSTFVETLQELAGNNAFSTISIKGLGNEQQIANLEGKLFNFTEETSNRGITDSALFKNLISGGNYMIKKVYKQPYPVANRAKLILAMNEMPKLGDTTHGMLRRMLVVPFDARFEGNKENLEIKKELFQELPGILNRVIEGYYRLKRQKHFTTSPIIRGEVESYQRENDNVYNFVKELLDICPEYGQEDFTYLSELYSRYREFCEDNGDDRRDVLPRVSFSKRLFSLLPDKKGRQTQKGKGRNRALLGVKLKFENPKEY